MANGRAASDKSRWSDAEIAARNRIENFPEVHAIYQQAALVLGALPSGFSEFFQFDRYEGKYLVGDDKGDLVLVARGDRGDRWEEFRCQSAEAMGKRLALDLAVGLGTRDAMEAGMDRRLSNADYSNLLVERQLHYLGKLKALWPELALDRGSAASRSNDPQPG